MEAEEVLHRPEGLAARPHIGLRPRGQRLIGPVARSRRSVSSVDAKARLAEVRDLFVFQTMSGTQQTAEEVGGLPLGIARGGVFERFPEGARGALLAAAEQRPAHTALVIQRAGER